MTDYSEDGKWWWNGESWIPTTQQQQSNVSASNKPVTTNISEKVSSFSSQFGASNHLSEEASSPRVIVSKSSKKKLTLNLVTQNDNRKIEFSKIPSGMGYNIVIDNKKPVLVTGKFGAFSRNTTGNGLTGFKTKTKHYFGKDLQSCELIFHYKSGMMSSNIKKIEISSTTGFYFSHEI
jgi:hypothetical protein